MDRFVELEKSDEAEKVINKRFTLAANAILDDLIRCSLYNGADAPLFTEVIGQHVATILFIFQDDDGVEDREAVDVLLKMVRSMACAVIYCYDHKTRTIDCRHLRVIYEQYIAGDIPLDSDVRAVNNIVILQTRYFFRRCLATVLEPNTPKLEKLAVERYLRAALSALPSDTFTDPLFAQLYLSAHRSAEALEIPRDFALSPRESIAFTGRLTDAYKASPDSDKK